MPKISYIKAFTQEPERGNPAAVIEGNVEGEDALTAVREARYAISAIIDTSASGDVPIRFFYENGATETFACGHATLAAAHVLLPGTSHKITRNLINAKGNIIEVVRFKDGRISQEQPTPDVLDLKFEKSKVAEALGIHPDQIESHLPIRLAGIEGKTKLLIPVEKETLIALNRDFTKIKTFCDNYSSNTALITGLFPFATNLEDYDAHARHFPSRDEEDLVCGVGSLALAEYLKQHLQPTQNQFNILCGPGTDGVGEVIISMKDGKVFIEGYAVEES